MKKGKRNKEIRTGSRIDVELSKNIGRLINRRLKRRQALPFEAREGVSVGGDGNGHENSGEFRRREEQRRQCHSSEQLAFVVDRGD